MRMQQKLAQFFLLLFITPSLLASERPANYPQNPLTQNGIACVSNSKLQCFKRSDMQPLWESKIIHSPAGLVMQDGKLFVNSDHAALILNTSDGAVIDRIKNEGTLFDPVIADGRLILTDQQGWMRVIEISSRRTLWRKKIETSWVYPPAVIGNTLFSGGREGILKAIDFDSGNILWQKKIGQEFVYRPIVADGKIFISSFDAMIRAINPATRKIVSSTRLGSPLFEIKSDQNKQLIGAGYDGNLYAIDSETGQIMWRNRVANSLRYHFNVSEQEVSSIDFQGNFTRLDKQTGQPVQHTQFEGRHQISPMMTHSNIRLFPEEKPFITISKKKWGQTDS